MANVKTVDIKKLSTTKQEFMSALKRVSKRIEQPVTKERGVKND